MKRILGVALGAAVLLAAAALLRKGRDDHDDVKGPQNRSTNTPAAPATGRETGPDVLGAAHALSPSEAEQARAQERLAADGKATSPEREQMYENLGDVAVSGSQGNTLGREDQNPIGPQH